MTNLNWEQVVRSPFTSIWLFSTSAIQIVGLALYRIVTVFKSHPSNFSTAWRSIVLRTFFGNAYTMVYSNPSYAVHESRVIKTDDFTAYVVSPKPTDKLSAADVVILYFHGGGYMIGEPLQYVKSFKRWKKKALSVGVKLEIVTVKYRMIFLSLYLWKFTDKNSSVG
jgi:hypothetical protein